MKLLAWALLHILIGIVISSIIHFVLGFPFSSFGFNVLFIWAIGCWVIIVRNMEIGIDKPQTVKAH